MDIVERLRRDADRMGSTDRIGMAHEAADEIERLRVAANAVHAEAALADQFADAFAYVEWDCDCNPSDPVLCAKHAAFAAYDEARK